MNEKIASDIIYKLSKPEIIDVLTRYADDRIEKLNELLHKSYDIGQVRALQGQIQELKDLKTIRETASAILKGARK